MKLEINFFIISALFIFGDVMAVKDSTLEGVKCVTPDPAPVISIDPDKIVGLCGQKSDDVIGEDSNPLRGHDYSKLRVEDGAQKVTGLSDTQKIIPACIYGSDIDKAIHNADRVYELSIKKGESKLEKEDKNIFSYCEEREKEIAIFCDKKIELLEKKAAKEYEENQYRFLLRAKEQAGEKRDMSIALIDQCLGCTIDLQQPPKTTLSSEGPKRTSISRVEVEKEKDDAHAEYTKTCSELTAAFEKKMKSATACISPGATHLVEAEYNDKRLTHFLEYLRQWSDGARKCQEKHHRTRESYINTITLLAEKATIYKEYLKNQVSHSLVDETKQPESQCSLFTALGLVSKSSMKKRGKVEVDGSKIVPIVKLKQERKRSNQYYMFREAPSVNKKLKNG